MRDAAAVVKWRSQTPDDEAISKSAPLTLGVIERVLLQFSGHKSVHDDKRMIDHRKFEM